MTYGALYLATLSALLAQWGARCGLDADEGFVVSVLCGAMLLAGAALLLIGSLPE